LLSEYRDAELFLDVGDSRILVMFMFGVMLQSSRRGSGVIRKSEFFQEAITILLTARFQHRNRDRLGIETLVRAVMNAR
jgi:hypothetical protein